MEQGDASKEKDLLHGLLIDPDKRRVELVRIGVDDVASLIGATITATFELNEAHGMVVDDDHIVQEHAGRFHFRHGRLRRPFFGAVLIVGMRHGNWTDSSMDIKEVKADVVWELWDAHKDRYEQVLTGSL